MLTLMSLKDLSQCVQQQRLNNFHVSVYLDKDVVLAATVVKRAI
jgi:hypothetical protein